jgi:mRNA-degrading endonuclease YafQ of YafQ-DinJ toxin-antitoxin module
MQKKLKKSTQFKKDLKKYVHKPSKSGGTVPVIISELPYSLR